MERHVRVSPFLESDLPSRGLRFDLARPDVATGGGGEPKAPMRPEPHAEDPRFSGSAYQGAAVADRPVLLPDSVLAPRRRPGRPRIAPARFPMTRQQQRDVLECIRDLHIKRYRMASGDSTLDANSRNRWIRVEVLEEVTESPTDLCEVVYGVRMREDGHTLTSLIRVKRSSYSQFAHYVDFWNPRVAVHDDIIVGRFHTNSPFSVSDMYGVMPMFKGRVTTTAWKVEMHGAEQRGLSTFFQQGIETRSEEIPMLGRPGGFDPHAEAVQRVKAESWINFHGGGYFSFSDASGEEGVRRIPPGKPAYIVGGSKDPVHLKGVVRGQVLVYSEGDIIIDGDITYAHHPAHTPDSQDFLGIVSLRDVSIAERRVTGPGDVTIHAAVFAGRRFRVSEYYRSEHALLHVYGSLSAGTMSPTEPRFGTRVVFDKRFETQRPPNFPMTDQFDIVDWNRQWTLESPEVVETANIN